MSSYFVKGKGWRYDFTLKGKRYTNAWYRTKKEAKQAEAKHREDLERPLPAEGPTDTDFFTLVEARLDHVKNHHSERHYTEIRTCDLRIRSLLFSASLKYH
ncbi:MAG: hypothetical protein AB1568_04845 [Thermodesulfobacteriota bacterium]